MREPNVRRHPYESEGSSSVYVSKHERHETTETPTSIRLMVDDNNKEQSTSSGTVIPRPWRTAKGA